MSVIENGIRATSSSHPICTGVSGRGLVSTMLVARTDSSECGVRTSKVETVVPQ